MKAIITAGGTVEPVDRVRSITNRSTGRLGKAIAESLVALGGDRVERIFYVHGPGAALPEAPRTTCVRVERVEELGEVLKRLLGENEVGAIVHAMAVSDYRVASATTIGALAEAAARAAKASAAGGLAGPGELAEVIAAAMRSVRRIDEEKISSNLEDPVLLLEPTPKVITGLRDLAPEAVIVGFKLLSGADQAELLAAGRGLLESARCSYAFANDARDAFGSGYAGYLIAPGGEWERLERLDAIARRIAEVALSGEEGVA